MSDLILDEDLGDLNFADGDLALTEGREAIRQRLAMRLRLVKGEWFLNYLEGTDYFGQIFGKKTEAQINAELVRVILTTEGVTGLVNPIEFRLNRTRRILEVSFEVTTEEGTIDVEETLPLAPS